MKRNGSPKARFEADLRLWFLVELPIHKAFRDKANAKTNQVTDHVTDHVTDYVKRLLSILANGPMNAPTIMLGLKLTHRPTLRANYLHTALEMGLVEMTSPESPRIRQQQYRLTPADRQLLPQLDRKSYSPKAGTAHPVRRHEQIASRASTIR